MAEYSKLARGSFTSTGSAQVIQLPFQPGYVEMFNYSAHLAAPAANAVLTAHWFFQMGQGFAMETAYNATPVLVGDAVIVNGISTFSAAQALQYGPTLSITGITKAASGVVTTSASHNLASGDVVVMQGLYQTTTTGMPQIAGMPFTVTVLSPTTFSIPWNTNQTSYTALSGSPAGATVKKVLYPFLYFPGENVISAISTGSTTTITTTSAHNYVVGQQVAFRVPSTWGTTQLNSLPNSTIPGSPMYGFVISVTNYNTFVVNINSSAYTAFNSNPTVAQSIGLTFPQIVAVGDINTGGVQVSSGSMNYPAPQYLPLSTTPKFSTINGPAIQGAFVNNSAQGFIIGAGAGSNLTSSVLVGTAGNLIYWRAIDSDFVLTQ